MVLETWRALLAPRRLLAILVIAVPLLAVQQELIVSPWALPLLAAIMIVLLLTAPVAYRRLLSPERPRRTFIPRLLAYALLGGIAPLALHEIPRLLGLRAFVSTDPTLIISAGLFWVAGYGLGRDVDLELRWQAAAARAETLARDAERAQLLAIRVQLDPHFLFNTLNAIAEWCREDPAVAERALLDLSTILRDVLLGVRAAAWPLEKELTVVRRLFDLHRMRDPERFDVSWEVDLEPEAIDVPPLLLLPLAENAMTHGPSRGHRGTVSLAARKSGERIEIAIENPGPYSGRRAGGEGLATVEKRLALAYDGQAELEIAAKGDRTRAVVRWPGASKS